MKKLLILDSNSILNRAYYGVSPLSTRDGLPTNAVYGFMNIIIKLINDFKPDYICAAYDLKGSPHFAIRCIKNIRHRENPCRMILQSSSPYQRIY